MSTHLIVTVVGGVKHHSGVDGTGHSWYDRRMKVIEIMAWALCVLMTVAVLVGVVIVYITFLPFILTWRLVKFVAH